MALPGQGLGLNELQRSLSPLNILEFCERTPKLCLLVICALETAVELLGFILNTSLDAMAMEWEIPGSQQCDSVSLVRFLPFRSVSVLGYIWQIHGL